MSSKQIIALVSALGCLGVIAGAVFFGYFGWVGYQAAVRDRTARMVDDYERATREEVERFGAELQALVKQGGGASDVRIDMVAIAVRGLPENLVQPQEQRGFVEGVRNAPGRFSMSMEQAVAEGGQFSFRGVAEREGEMVARFRIRNIDGGINMADLTVSRRVSDGLLRATEVFLLNTGEPMSQTIARFGGAEHMIDHAEDIMRMQRLAQQRDAEGALAVYDSLPQGVQRMRTVWLSAAQTATFLEDESRFLQLVDGFLEAFPGDPSGHYLAWQVYLLRQQWNRCLASLAVLGEEFPDPFWTAMQAIAQARLGQLDAARLSVARAAEQEPDLLEVYDAKLVMGIESEDMDAANKALDILIADFAVDPNGLAAMEGYEDITALPAFQTYNAAQPAYQGQGGGSAP